MASPAPGLLPTPSPTTGTHHTSSQTWKSRLFPRGPDLSLDYYPPTGGTVVIYPEDLAEGSKKWENSLVGFFIGRSPPLAKITANLSKAWRGIRFDLSPMAAGFFLFDFEDRESGQRALQRGIISVNGHCLILKRWTPSFSFRMEEMPTIPIWINLPYLMFRSEICVAKIASVVGNPLCIDRTALNYSKLELARVCVEVSAGSPLPDSVKIRIGGAEATPTIQKVQYYWKPSACTHCKIFNHSTKGCKSQRSTSASISTEASEAKGVAVTWTRPQDGQLKVNFDGSVKCGSASAGFVIRDASGDVILAGNTSFAFCSVVEAELRGACIGLQAAVERLHATSIWLEGDSRTVISWINGAELCKSPPNAQTYLQDIQSWITTLDSFRATHVFREGNQPADWLARNAMSTTLQIWSSDFPAPVLPLLSADANGCVYTRLC